MYIYFKLSKKKCLPFISVSKEKRILQRKPYENDVDNNTIWLSERRKQSLKGYTREEKKEHA